jgi:hypothetical protein
MAANHSITSSVFLNSALDLVRRLSPDPSPAGFVLAEEARALVELFQSWEREKPADDDRIATIQRLFELNRRAMDHLAKSGPSSGVRTSTIPRGDH